MCGGEEERDKEGTGMEEVSVAAMVEDYAICFLLACKGRLHKNCFVAGTCMVTVEVRSVLKRLMRGY